MQSKFTPKNYRESLRKFIIGRKSKMLLQARDFFPQATNAERSEAAFHLTSGRYRRQFISLWELFDNGLEFDKCILELTRKAVEINNRRGYVFNTIVTCTHTARELVRHIRPGIEKQLDRPIEVSEFGHYPYNTASELELHAFRSRNVLIFTDVMASGSLVRDMATRVERTGGNVIAGLCIVVSDGRLVAQLSSDGVVHFPIREDLKRRHVPIFSLTDYEIPELPEGNPPPKKICRIDFVTVFPETPPSSDHEIKACFPRDRMLAHFRATKALTHGFFKNDDRHYTLGVRVERILNGPITAEVWRAIRRHVPMGATLISTFKQHDLALGRFVHDRLAQEGRKTDLFILKRELGDFPHLHQALFPNTKRVRGRKVVLLRATATTSEELRTLAALLAGERVNEIRVICLVNRMGPYTVSFVQRVRELVSGSSRSKKRTEFKFVPVYHLTDVRTDDLVTMHRRVADVLDKYARSTEVPFFKALTQEYRMKMTPASMATLRFQNAEAIDLTLKVAEAIEEIGKHRTEKILALIQDPSLESEHAEVFLLVAGLIISDVDYFRLNKDLSRVIKAMRNRIEELRHNRLKKEAEAGGEDCFTEEDGSILTVAIDETIQLETHLLFAMALLAHFDKHERSAEEIIRDTLFANLPNEEWQRFPRNLRYHFRDGHFYWLTAFLLHGVHPDVFSQPSGTGSRQQLAQLIRERIQSLVEHLPATAHLSDEDGKLLPGRINDHKNDLLSELGALSRGLWHQRIRFLQHHILHRRLGHSPIWMALKQAEEDFDEWLDHAEAGQLSAGVMSRMPRRIKEAHSAAITVGEIADVAHHFAMYPSQEVAGGLRFGFINPNASDSFMQQVVAPLLAFFQDGQGNPPATRPDFEVYKNLIFRVKDTILDPTCKLYELLLGFCLPLRKLLCDVLGEVDHTLTKDDLPDVWSQVIAIQQDELKRADGEVYGLCDGYLLREIFRNVCSNVRHNLLGARITGPLSSHVRISISEVEDKLPEPEAVQQHFIVIAIEADGKSYSEVAKNQARKAYTLKSHTERIAEFGGTVQIGDRPDGHGSRAVIKLISRQDAAPLIAETAE